MPSCDSERNGLSIGEAAAMIFISSCWRRELRLTAAGDPKRLDRGFSSTRPDSSITAGWLLTIGSIFMTSRTALILLVLILCLSLEPLSVVRSESEAPAPAAWDLPRLMALMADVTSTKETFTETKSLAILTDPLVLSGDLSYTRPDRIEKHVRAPYEEQVIVEGDTLTLVNKDGKKTIALHKYPMIRAFVESIRATLAGDAATLRRFYHLVLAGDRNQWILTLRPRDEQLAEHVRSIKLTGTDNRVTRVDIREQGGDSSAMTIRRTGS